MEWLETVCNIIIIIGGAVMAVKNVSEWFGKPIRFFKQKTEESFDEKIKKVVGEIMPALFQAHDLETREKYLSDREKYLQDIKREVLSNVQDELGQVSKLTSQYEALAISAKDVLREKIVCMYENNKDARTLRFFERRALDQYYKDYKKLGGNSYIDIIYNRMITWEVIPDDYQ